MRLRAREDVHHEPVELGVWIVPGSLVERDDGRLFNIAVGVPFSFGGPRQSFRAFAVGLGVVTIRVWVGLLAGTGFVPLEQSLALAFWLDLSMHVVAAEVWLWWRPDADGLSRCARTPAPGGAAAGGDVPA